MNKIAFLLAFLTLSGYLISINSASFYMLKGFQNALYLNVSPQSFVLQYPINTTSTTTINVYATYIPFSYFGNALYNGYIQLSGINGTTFLGNLSFIPYAYGFLIPKFTLLGNTYKTLAVYYNGTSPSYSGYYSKTYTDTLQNNYEFIYYSFYNYNTIPIQAKTIPAQPNNATNTGGIFQISFDTLPIPYFLITSPTNYYNLTYYRGTGIIARQIIALHKFFNTSVNLIGNGEVFTQNIINTNYNGGLLLNPNGKIWLGYLNMPFYYYNYSIINASTIYPITTGLYYSNYNYILNILMPNTQKVYSSPNYFYYLIPAYANANITLQASQQQNVTNLPNFEYQFNLTNINWTMRPSDWLNWSGGYTIKGFYNPPIKTSYVMFSLPAYPCLQSADGSFGNIQAYGYQGSTNLGRIPISQFQKQGNTIYYIMPNLTSKGLAYSNAVVYICSPNSNSPSQLSTSNFVIADFQGSGNATGKTYTINKPNVIIFINPTLFYGNESIISYSQQSYGEYVAIYSQKLMTYWGTGFGPYISTLNQLANNKIYITYPALWFGSNDTISIWANNEAIASIPTANQPLILYNTTTNITSQCYFNPYLNTQFNLPYDAHATIVNYFTTKYQMGNLTAVASPSSSSSSSVSNPVILPSSPKLNLSITNTTLTNNLNNLKQQFNKQVVVYGMNIPLGLIYIVDLFLIIALAIFSKHEGAFIIALAIFWFSGLLFIQQLIIAAIITIAYATYRLEGIFHKEG